MSTGALPGLHWRSGRWMGEHVFVPRSLAARAEASILHADLDSFFASVEQRDNPRLRSRPMAVGGGVVLACSYEAKAFGVRSAMGGRQARTLCPQLIFVPPRMEAYAEASRQVFEVFADTSPIVEGLSIDEAFLDVAGLGRFGTPREIAAELRRQVKERVGLPITVGVARTKFLAKVASVSAKPDGLLVVEPDGELDFLHPLPVERLWGVGPKTAEKLHNVGLFTVREVAELAEATLISILGAASGRHLHALAHNRDPRPLIVGRRRGSIGSQHALGRFGEPKTRQELEAFVVALVDRVTRRMRKAHRVGRTVVLRVRFDDFGRTARSHTLPRATSHTDTILGAAQDLLVSLLPATHERGCTLVGLTVGNLDDADAVQLPLPFDAQVTTSLDAAVDDLRERFGASAITRAVLLGRNPHVAMPMLPD